MVLLQQQFWQYNVCCSGLTETGNALQLQSGDAEIAAAEINALLQRLELEQLISQATQVTGTLDDLHSLYVIMLLVLH